ncbi:SDR family oxidoreductase [Pseudonocardia sp. GCM10023141]|uniref:SDR family oxidoreductase n=1 Tax=Pseudonocardia sp. GCM10023141 TaxID=3252653 RepID=UPI00360EECC3
MASQPLAVITGAAGGIGAATAQSLSAAGYEVLMIDRNVESLQVAVKDVQRRGGTARALELDLLDMAAVTAALADFEGRSRVQALVNAAGIVAFGDITDIGPDRWNTMLGIKLGGNYLTCHSLIPAIAENGGGAIVNIASMSGRTKSLVSGVDYSTANAGVIGMTMTLAAQNAKRGVRVNCIAPGMVQTPMLDGYEVSHLDAIRSAIPMQRFAKPEEIASVVAFLVSDAASYITGETINANGGMFTV